MKNMTIPSNLRGEWEAYYAMPYYLQEQLVSHAIEVLERQERSIYLLDLTNDPPFKQPFVRIGKSKSVDIHTPNLIIGRSAYDGMSKNHNLQELITSVARTITPCGYFVFTVQCTHTYFNMTEKPIGMHLTPIDQIALWLARANFMPEEVLHDPHEGYAVFLAKKLPSRSPL